MTKELTGMPTSAAAARLAGGELSDEDLEVVVGGLARAWTSDPLEVPAPAEPMTGTVLPAPFLKPAEA